MSEPANTPALDPGRLGPLRDFRVRLIYNQMNPGRAAATGAHNRARALAFDWEHVAQALVDVYARVAAAPARF